MWEIRIRFYIDVLTVVHRSFLHRQDRTLISAFIYFYFSYELVDLARVYSTELEGFFQQILAFSPTS